MQINAGTPANTVISNQAALDLLGATLGISFAASSDGDPSTPGAQPTTLTTDAPPSATLSLSKIGTPDPVVPGNQLTYTLTVTNSGPSPAANTVVTDATPTNTTFASASAPAGWTITTPAAGSTGTVQFSNASLAVGTYTLTLVVNVNASAPAPGTISNTATVASPTDVNGARRLDQHEHVTRAEPHDHQERPGLGRTEPGHRVFDHGQQSGAVERLDGHRHRSDTGQHDVRFGERAVGLDGHDARGRRHRHGHVRECEPAGGHVHAEPDAARHRRRSRRLDDDQHRDARVADRFESDRQRRDVGGDRAQSGADGRQDLHAGVRADRRRQHALARDHQQRGRRVVGARAQRSAADARRRVRRRPRDEHLRRHS